jgi:hypothetical protein
MTVGTATRIRPKRSTDMIMTATRASAVFATVKIVPDPTT